MPDLDIVIVNYMSAAHTLNCVRAVRDVAEQDGLSVQIIAINNGDDDNRLTQDLTTAEDVLLVNNTSNAGFGRASNQGAALGRAPIILFLNPDATLLPGALKTCIGEFDVPAQKDTGIIGPEIVDGRNQVLPSSSRLPTATDLLLRSIGAHVVFKETGYPFLPLEAHQESKFVGQIMGAALFIRRSVFEELGGFDTRFFLYYEDVDLCARAQNAGYGCLYNKGARVIHIGRTSSSQDAGRALALHARSRITYARIHFGGLQQFILCITILLAEFPTRTLRAFFGGGVLSVRDMLRAYRLFVLSLFSSARGQGFKAAPGADKA